LFTFDKHAAPCTLIFNKHPEGGKQMAKKAKWGKMGAPKSAKRRAFLKKIRRKK
jgi:hypothetical protein